MLHRLCAMRGAFLAVVVAACWCLAAGATNKAAQKKSGSKVTAKTKDDFDVTPEPGVQPFEPAPQAPRRSVADVFDNDLAKMRAREAHSRHQIMSQFMRNFANNMKYAVLADSKGDMPEAERQKMMQNILRKRHNGNYVSEDEAAQLQAQGEEEAPPPERPRPRRNHMLNQRTSLSQRRHHMLNAGRRHRHHSNSSDNLASSDRPVMSTQGRTLRKPVVAQVAQEPQPGSSDAPAPWDQESANPMQPAGVPTDFEDPNAQSIDADGNPVVHRPQMPVLFADHPQHPYYPRPLRSGAGQLPLCSIVLAASLTTLGVVL